nr:aminomethyltransferase family protein [Shinella daejeonensis]
MDADDLPAAGLFDAEAEPGTQIVLKAERACAIYLILPILRDGLLHGGGGRLSVQIRGGRANTRLALPDPLGKVVDEWRVPRATAFAYQVRKGQFIQIIDVEGQQCSDFMAMRADALDAGIERYIDGTVTRSATGRAYPQPGLHDKYYDQDIRPLLAVRQDTVGRHDSFALACTGYGYEERGFPGHVNCSDNISEVYAPYGIQRRRAWPAINLFFNSWILPTNNVLRSDEAWSRPGDYVVMEALTDLVCVSTACPDDIDPINNWNPTDIHVRVYEEKTSISRAVVYRTNIDDRDMKTENSPFHEKTSRLTRAYAVARNTWLPTRYDATGAVEEYWACKRAATLQDMSSLRKYDVMGPDAERLLQHCLTRDVARLAVNRGLYALLCDERGSVLDDGTLFRLAPDLFRWCCGTEDSSLHLREQAEKLGLRVWIKSLSEQMPSLAIQGPKSRAILEKVVFTKESQPTLQNLKWFGFTLARLRDGQGAPFMLARSGFTGELGYEIFCDRANAEEIWDTLIEAGTAHGLVPMGAEALDMLRIEAGLMARGAEFGPDVDAFESGLGFAVDLKKADFVGRAALERNSVSPRRRLMGLLLGGNDLPAHGDPVFLGREQVGVVTSATRSPELGSAIAMARIAVENAVTGTALEIGRLDGRMKRLAATVTTLPFLDAAREKPRA